MDKINPYISVLLPNLNSRPFLEERIQTILDQTFTNWELIVVDGYSDDGSWELIQEFLKKEARMRISQAPRKGIYDAFNRCIQHSRGEYIYIATSDDTMMPDCLEKMIAALDAHPECGICHSCLKVIDEKGEEIHDYWHKLPPIQFYGDLMNKPHIRYAPYDAILYCLLTTVYTSMTQLLIRRSVFDEVGLFQTHWGPIGDNEWEMRATLLFNTLHIPEILSTWRIHPKQQTNPNNHLIPSFYTRFIEMIQSSFKSSGQKLRIKNPECYKRIRMSRLLYLYAQEYIKLSLGKIRNPIQKILFLSELIFNNPINLSEYIYRRIFGKLLNVRDFTYVRKELKRLGLENHIKILE